MSFDKNLSTKQLRRIKKIDKSIDQARENSKIFLQEIKELKFEKAEILCSFSIGDKVIRQDGQKGIISKIVLSDNLPIISVFKQNTRRKKFSYAKGEHYRTKPDEIWELAV